jgi:hypothetical protein
MIDFQSNRIQLVITALVASLSTFGILSEWDKRKRRRKHDLLIQQTQAQSSCSINEPLATRKLPVPQSGAIEGDESTVCDEGLVREQLARNYAFFGDEGMSKIRRANVVVVGCGGVGSWAAVMLVRS